MGKLEVVVPSKHSNVIRDVLIMNRSVHHLSYRKCIITDEFNNNNQLEAVNFSFMVVNKKTHELIDLLTRYGVSARFGSLNVTALTSTKPRVSTEKNIRSSDSLYSTPSNTERKKKRKFNVSDRLAYDEVYDTIDSQLHLTFDYLALIFVGGCIAGIGLLTNSAVAVVASMLVSPLMGPIVGMTFGSIINDKQMFWKSFRNELIGVTVCFLTGALMGFITAPIMDTPRSEQLAFGANTQISSRGEWIALAWGAGVAAPSGIGVALGVSADQVSALIGVAISAALLPPIVNSGCCLASALVFYIDPRYDYDVVMKWWQIGYISMMLFLLNWILIFIFGTITFRVKKLHRSANEQMKMENYNKFYLNIDKLEEANRSSSGLKKKKKESLQSPLLDTNTNQMRSSSMLIDSMDGVPNLLAELSEDTSTKNQMNEEDKVNDMINWDKVKPRSNRGMSDIRDSQNFSAKRMNKKLRKKSFDASTNIGNASLIKSKDDIV